MGKPYRYVQLIKPYCVVLQVTKGIQYYMQWNLSTMDTLGTKTFVLIGEMSFNSLYLYQPDMIHALVKYSTDNGLCIMIIKQCHSEWITA